MILMPIPGVTLTVLNEVLIIGHKHAYLMHHASNLCIIRMYIYMNDLT